MEKTEKRQMTKNAGLVGGWTFLSRIFGFIRDAAMAWFFGTARALFYYALGLWAFTSTKIVVSTFYALQNAGTPVRIALVFILVKVIRAVVFIRFLDYKGLALSTSLASVLNLIFLIQALQMKLGHIDWKNTALS